MLNRLNHIDSLAIFVLDSAVGNSYAIGNIIAMTQQARRSRSDQKYSSFVSVERALAILEILGRHQKGLTLSELADAAHVSLATTHRILTTLSTAGYVIRRNERWCLSLSLITLAYRFMWALEWKHYYADAIEKLSDDTGELVQVAVIHQGALFYIDKVEGRHALRVASLVGQEGPIHATASGKVWLASLDDQALVHALSRIELKAYTKRTLTTLDALMADLKLVRQRGYAISIEEHSDGVAAVAAPITPLPKNVVIGAVSIAFPSSRATLEVIEQYAQAVMRCASELTAFGIRVFEEFPVPHLKSRGSERASGV